MQQAYPDADIQLIPASGGLFEVTVDDALIFSKRAQRRHAAPGEVLELIRQKGLSS
ncbi:MAG: SelT/SelW/SelH family protein [Bacillota bacterium]